MFHSDASSAKIVVDYGGHIDGNKKSASNRAPEPPEDAESLRVPGPPGSAWNISWGLYRAVGRVNWSSGYEGHMKNSDPSVAEVESKHAPLYYPTRVRFEVTPHKVLFFTPSSKSSIFSHRNFLTVLFSASTPSRISKHADHCDSRLSMGYLQPCHR